MEFRGTPRVSMEIHGNPWSSVEFHETINGVPWSSTELRGVSRCTMGLRGAPRASMVFRRVPCNCQVPRSTTVRQMNSMEFHGAPRCRTPQLPPWKFMAVAAEGTVAFHRVPQLWHHGAPWNLDGTSWNFTELHGAPWNIYGTP